MFICLYNELVLMWAINSEKPCIVYGWLDERDRRLAYFPLESPCQGVGFKLSSADLAP